MNPIDLAGRDHVSQRATEFLVEWLCRAENQAIRDQIRAYAGIVPDRGTAIRMAIMGVIAPLPVSPGDKMEFLVEAIQTMFALADWVVVADQMSVAP